MKNFLILFLFIFRKKYGIQFCLDIIRQYYAKPENLTEEDGKSVRLALLEIVKYYIQKEFSIKDVSFFLKINFFFFCRMNSFV